ncbi:MAG: thioredoxin domain-containing protein [Methanobacterium sp. BRmetb2]|nr:MAG: thioredoxin domain-containing protein [Methanobacterium sp. BRmetb2]
MSPKSEKEAEYTNKLIKEKNPYLLQHAHNPVDWYPWSEEAFQKAKDENKPIFLSIGYSTCHWCHVMAHESFEDPDVAQLMNETFISIKVDREERPDIDSVYMTVCQVITGTGGWPLSIIMTPNKKPFFAGTYIPKDTIYGRTGLKDITLNIKELWSKNPEEALKSADKIVDVVEEISLTSPGDQLDESILKKAYSMFQESYDENYGGFGMIQKFPSPHNLMFLLRYHMRYDDQKALEMVEKTLSSMKNGGIYDHIGHGFHRYSVDPQWLVPHFEKMLYDQAMIAIAYIEAFQITRNPLYKKTAQEIFTYVLRDMQSNEGGFYSAEDADSEGVEGKFYVWTKNEFIDVLGEDAELMSRIFNVRGEGNFKEESTLKKTGTNILHLKMSLSKIAEKMNISQEELEKKIEKTRQKLFKTRESRIHPHKDDKILLDWNGLMIAALSKGAQVFKADEYREAAISAADFILENMLKDGRLIHSYRDGEATGMGNLDDYSFFIWGLLELFETTFKSKYLKMALELNEILLKQFWDSETGGFYFTSADAEEILVRKKESYDSAIPAGNSVQMLNLLKLAVITENLEYVDKAVSTEKTFSEKVKRSPSAYTQLLMALDFKLGPSYEIVIAGNPKFKDTTDMLEIIYNNFLPNKVLILREEGKLSNDLKQISETLNFKKPLNGKATVYICTEGACKKPTINIDEMKDLLNVK